MARPGRRPGCRSRARHKTGSAGKSARSGRDCAIVAASAPPPTNPAAAPSPASSRAKLRTKKLPEMAHSASDTTQASVPQRTEAARPKRRISSRGEQRADEIAGGIDGVHEARGGIRPCQRVPHVRQHQRIGEAADAEPDRRRQRQDEDQPRGMRGGRDRSGAVQGITPAERPYWQARPRLHRRGAAMVSCQCRSAALALRAEFPHASCPGVDPGIRPAKELAGSSPRA